MVLRTYAVMTNDVLIAVPLFIFMGYLVERANLIQSLFQGMHLAMARIPGSLAVATIATCAIFATATGIVGAVVTLMGLLAMPAMLRAGYSVQLTAGSITAGGCLGILLPPSVLLILYGAVAGVSVVKLYAGAFFPGLLLAVMYVLYVIILAKLKPSVAPPLSAEDRIVPLPAFAQTIKETITDRAVPGLISAMKGPRNVDVPMKLLLKNLAVALLPAAIFLAVMGFSYQSVTAPKTAEHYELQEMGGGFSSFDNDYSGGGLAEPPGAGGLSEPEGSEPLVSLGANELGTEAPAPQAAATEETRTAERQAAPMTFWIFLIVGSLALLFYYAMLNFARLEIFKMLLSSFFPLTMLILAVLGSIIVGLCTPTEAAALGALGGILLAFAYRRLNFSMVRESVYLSAKTSAMVCWLFVGSSIFSAAFALLGGQELINNWVLSMDLTPIQFMILAQVVIFLLGWPLEWTEIIIIFMPIFLPLLAHYQIDPLFFGLLVALNLQTAFLSPPVAMSAFYLKGVSPPHVTLNQIFLGMLPFMGIQILAIIVLYLFPDIGLWLPRVLY
ncbi:MAG: TRAP transporter large permease subunit, partial [Alcaligenes sp.]